VRGTEVGGEDVGGAEVGGALVGADVAIGVQAPAYAETAVVKLMILHALNAAMFGDTLQTPDG
jgi:hypothetical protein